MWEIGGWALFLFAAVAGGAVIFQAVLSLQQDAVWGEIGNIAVKKPAKRVLYGRGGNIVGAEGTTLRIEGAHPYTGKREVFVVEIEKGAEWLEARIKNQLPRNPDGTFEHSGAIQVAATRALDLQAGEYVYVVSRDNIVNKSRFSAFRVYKVVYE